jgi:hypothetical protein
MEPSWAAQTVVATTSMAAQVALISREEFITLFAVLVVGMISVLQVRLNRGRPLTPVPTATWQHLSLN